MESGVGGRGQGEGELDPNKIDLPEVYHTTEPLRALFEHNSNGNLESGGGAMYLSHVTPQWAGYIKSELPLRLYVGKARVD